jgi:2-oxoisovalerate dehydrogenase E1 component
MISHLGSMLAPVVGAVFGARRRGEDAMGLAVIGDGGSSTGDFHESLNIASVQRVPVVFLVENNHYAYSTPTRYQYHCNKLSDRAAGYGIEGTTIDGTDVWEVYDTITNVLASMSADLMPRLIECMTLRLEGHAVYDKAEYVSAEERAEWLKREPLMRARKAFLEHGGSEEIIAAIERDVTELVEETAREALKFARPDPAIHIGPVFAPPTDRSVLPRVQIEQSRNLNAVTAALDYILQNFPNAFILGQDVGVYGSAFKSCKGLYEKYGAGRVMDMPLAESAATGFALGASQTGMLPIMEFQFADFSTEAVTQLGLNCGTWYYRAGVPARLLFRLPCGGGITLGAFHSGEFEGLWSRFPGLKLLYPVTPQETFEAIVAGFLDPNPCLVFEHKLLYGSKPGSIDFEGDAAAVWRPRNYLKGDDITIVAFGAMVELACTVVKTHNYSADVWNPFILNPLQLDAIIESVRRTRRLLVVQESGETAGLGDRIVSEICRRAFDALACPPKLISAPDAPVPFAKELEQVHIPDGRIINQAIAMMI